MNKNRKIKTWFLSVALGVAFFVGSNLGFGQNTVCGPFNGNLVQDGGFETGILCPACSDLPQVCAPSAGSYCIGLNPGIKNPANAGLYTANTGANLMEVDGFTTAAGGTVWRQANVCVLANSNYGFSFWIASHGPASPIPAVCAPNCFPSFMLRVNGVNVGGPITLTAANTGVWTQYNRVWNSGGTFGPVTISLFQVGGQTGGWDYGIDDIQFIGDYNIDFDAAITNLQCSNTCNGAINLTDICGRGPLTLVLNSPNGSFTPPAINGNAYNFANLCADNYSLTITDANGNQCTADYTINSAHSSPEIDGSACAAGIGENNGSIDITVTGGTPNYTFAWSNGLPSQEDQPNVGVGNYTVTVTDANGCTASKSFIVCEDRYVTSITGNCTSGNINLTLTRNDGQNLNTTFSICPGGAANLAADNGLSVDLFNHGAGGPHIELGGILHKNTDIIMQDKVLSFQGNGGSGGYGGNIGIGAPAGSGKRLLVEYNQNNITLTPVALGAHHAIYSNIANIPSGTANGTFYAFTGLNHMASTQGNYGLFLDVRNGTSTSGFDNVGIDVSVPAVPNNRGIHAPFAISEFGSIRVGANSLDLPNEPPNTRLFVDGDASVFGLRIRNLPNGQLTKQVLTTDANGNVILGTNGIITADNGLMVDPLNNNEVWLGGTLKHSTNINTNGNFLNITGSGKVNITTQLGVDMDNGTETGATAVPNRKLRVINDVAGANGIVAGIIGAGSPGEETAAIWVVNERSGAFKNYGLKSIVNGAGATFNYAGYFEASGGINNYALVTLGNVGINNLTPQFALDVSGDVRCTGNISQWSDERFKKDIKTLPNTIEKVKQLRAVDYNWKKEEFSEMKFSEGKQMGFLAQEMEKVYPELVTTDSKGYKSINYIGLIPVLTEAIKEGQGVVDEQKTKIEQQDKKIEEQKAQIEKQDKKLNEMESRLAEMENCLAMLCVENKTSGSNSIINNQQPTILNQNVPNPFDGKTIINYSLGEKSNVELNVYSVQGVLITTLTKGEQSAGSYSVDCCPNNELAPGSYIYVLKANGVQLQKKAIVIK